jgi:RNA polymerase primary sigma factor
MAMGFRWPDIVKTLAGDKSLWEVVKLHVIAKEEGAAPLFSEKQAKIFKEILESKLDLLSYLEESPGKELLNLSDDAFNELLYYSSITGEKNKAEIAQDLIDEVLNELTEHEKLVLQLSFGILGGQPRTFKEVGKQLNLTERRVEETAGRALRKLRHPTRSRRLRGLLSSIAELDHPSQNFLEALFGID